MESFSAFFGANLNPTSYELNFPVESPGRAVGVTHDEIWGHIAGMQTGKMEKDCPPIHSGEQSLQIVLLNETVVAIALPL